MFIYSVRASTIKFFGLVILLLGGLIALLAVGSTRAVETANTEVKFGGIKTNDDRVNFISQFGITVEEAPVDDSSFSVPEDFDKIISEYNELQKRQGLDVSKYKNKKVTRYTYKATNYKSDAGDVYVNLIVYKNTVIACDVSSADPRGFIEPLVKI